MDMSLNTGFSHTCLWWDEVLRPLKLENFLWTFLQQKSGLYVTLNVYHKIKLDFTIPRKIYIVKFYLILSYFKCSVWHINTFLWFLNLKKMLITNIALHAGNWSCYENVDNETPIVNYILHYIVCWNIYHFCLQCPFYASLRESILPICFNELQYLFKLLIFIILIQILLAG